MDTSAFRRILQLEEQQGYADKAIVGGIDKALYRLLATMESAITSPQKLNLFRNMGKNFAPYAGLSSEQRRSWIRGVSLFLGELDKLFENTATSDTTNEAKPNNNTTQQASSDGAPSAIDKTTAGATNTTQKNSAIIKKSPAKSKIVKIVPTDENAEIALNFPVTVIKGISDALAKKLSKLNINTIYDMCTHYPMRHLDYTALMKINQLQEGKEETIRAFVWEASTKKGIKGRESSEVILGDDTGNVRAFWFNNPYVAKNLKSGDEIIVSGRVNIVRGRAVFESPEWEYVEKAGTHTGRLVPVYPLTAGLTQRQARKLFKETAETYHNGFREFLPKEILERQQLISLPEAILQAHYPESIELKEQSRTRLAFDELFILQMGALSRKHKWQSAGEAEAITINNNVLQRFVSSLPFTMTDAQKRVTKEILKDITSTIPASRLIQGEVGSGKTVVAAIALLLCAADGKQGALMAPTEVLSEQHYRSLRRLYSALSTNVYQDENNPYITIFEGVLDKPLRIALLTGEVKGKPRKEIYENISSGTADIVVGTHAIIQKDVEFNSLALAVIDEQHRFGVNQRQELRNKGKRPHVVAMTATPIPRTLSLTIYGDLDLSVIDQMPEGRQKIKTKWLSPEERSKAYAFIEKQVAEGRQAFIICPLVEESESVAAKAATSEYEFLSQNVFTNRRVGLVTGRMSGKEKEETMNAFGRGEIDILVSTAVVEVGIDVPNASVMLVESAERFGLAQLHQFRGRVGRGEHQSYCLLLSEKPTPESMSRLRIIESTQDGFALAEEDLKMRGPGEFFGTRQSGVPELKMARLSDVMLLERARKEAEKLFREDPTLQNPALKSLAREIARVWSGVQDKLA